jgi:hypothetical protein
MTGPGTHGSSQQSSTGLGNRLAVPPARESRNEPKLARETISRRLRALRADQPQKTQSSAATGVNMATSPFRAVNRTGRLALDAIVLAVFSPIILVWWLNEKWQKRPPRS